VFSKRYYARKRFFSTVFNAIWSAITLIATLIVVLLIAYGCMRYLDIMGPAIE
jgi:hypothetical protein